MNSGWPSGQGVRPGVRPAPLRVGARLGLVAPAGPMLMDRLEGGLAPYRAAGFEVVRWRADLGYQAPAPVYLAGGDDARLEELTCALQDPSIDAVLCARGGYGSQRLLWGLEEALRRGVPPNPKPVVGFSDITALHSFCFHQLGWATLHAPMVFNFAPTGDAELSHGQQESWRWLRAALTQPGPQRLPCALALAGDGGRGDAAGCARGVLLGGNLTLVDALYRSAWMPTLRGAVLLLEDVGEALYRLDRMLTSLEGRGAAQEVAAVVLGSFTDCGGLSTGEASDEVVRMLSRWGVPVYRGLSVGHMHPNRACWLGRPASLDPERGLTIDESDA